MLSMIFGIINTVVVLFLLTPLAVAKAPAALKESKVNNLKVGRAIVSRKISGPTLKPERIEYYTSRYTDYLVDHLQLVPVSDIEMAKYAEKRKAHKKTLKSNLTSREKDREAKGKLFQKTLARLLDGSSQFLVCSQTDWDCLEKDPEIQPKARSRVSLDELGKRIDVNEPFEAEAYFTRRWWERRQDLVFSEKTVAQILAEKLRHDGTKKVSMALYGIDEIQKDPADPKSTGSMAPVYDAIIDAIKNGSDVKGLFDLKNAGGGNSSMRMYSASIDGSTISIADPAPKPISFSYLVNDPEYSMFGQPSWILDLVALGAKIGGKKGAVFSEAPSNDVKVDVEWLLNPQNSKKAKASVRAAFQYQDTLNLIMAMNQGITSDDQATARVEWPTRGLMHNKFIVLENNKGEKYIWTGTTNISNTCMGIEENANMAVYIKSQALAEVFEAEFNEMYHGPSIEGRPLTGVSHNEKRPNTNRYFKFNDDTEVRVHFSPTDDGEHRAILPMLRSAKKGDKLRISMFAGSGIEFVRAIQFAQARGADIQISMDFLTSSGPTMWFKSNEGNLTGPNPFPSIASRMGKLELRYNNWRGLNHMKTATLERSERLANGTVKKKTVMLIVGSQNWTAGGNDENDENMITIRNLKKSITIGDAYNKYFDAHVWPHSGTIKEMANKKVDPSLAED